MFSVFQYFKRAHPMQLFWFFVLITALIAYCILNVCGNTDCGCCSSSEKSKKRVRKERRKLRHNCQKCRTCRPLSQSIGQKLESYKDQEIAHV